MNLARIKAFVSNISYIGPPLMSLYDWVMGSKSDNKKAVDLSEVNQKMMMEISRDIGALNAISKNMDTLHGYITELNKEVVHLRLKMKKSNVYFRLFMIGHVINFLVMGFHILPI